LKRRSMDLFCGEWQQLYDDFSRYDVLITISKG
jgi:hypothetical protein